MSLLKQAGLVVSGRNGQFTFDRLEEDAIGVFPGALDKELSKPGEAVGQEFRTEVGEQPVEPEKQGFPTGGEIWCVKP